MLTIPRPIKSSTKDPTACMFAIVIHKAAFNSRPSYRHSNPYNSSLHQRTPSLNFHRASSMVSDLEAFSPKPTRDSVGALPVQATPLPIA
mmetsp:Transcript_8993/g.16612  ORF Transcript_8993/g.16612 Transcript_8993/m.16612 type:complete len:90 (-) Transcript_8993:3484-3753(-)